jgi:hypothetical protein
MNKEPNSYVNLGFIFCLLFGHDYMCICYNILFIFCSLFKQQQTLHQHRVLPFIKEQGTKLICKSWFYFSYTPCIKCYCSNKILSSCNDLSLLNDIKFTKPSLYYIRCISPWCTLFCEQKLYIASDCAVL